ncbi:hypothetical protein C477_00990 [Haloterrigena salina JCM 13891]|uniref:Uncharacterized protein n=1 Tax=Haloterrigena salina JCM 13891 TaxID=1227488 RepID=M0CPG0_9EURY|nr:hypothetical protein C477_00990 [Haloterrigena salina JCM 13891]
MSDRRCARIEAKRTDELLEGVWRSDVLASAEPSGGIAVFEFRFDDRGDLIAGPSPALETGDE